MGYNDKTHLDAETILNQNSQHIVNKESCLEAIVNLSNRNYSSTNLKFVGNVVTVGSNLAEQHIFEEFEFRYLIQMCDDGIQQIDSGRHYKIKHQHEKLKHSFNMRKGFLARKFSSFYIQNDRLNDAIYWGEISYTTCMIAAENKEKNFNLSDNPRESNFASDAYYQAGRITHELFNNFGDFKYLSLASTAYEKALELSNRHSRIKRIEVLMKEITP